MRHRVKGRKLRRNTSHRLATLRALSTALLTNKRIKTTTAKAKELRSFIEPLITKAIKGGLHNQRQVMDRIKHKEAVKELFTEIVPKINERPGGYTRVIKLGNRIGDAASMSIVELVDYNDVVNKRAEERKEEREERRTQKEKEEAEAQKAPPVTEPNVMEVTPGKETK